jgi:hypothetical protein
MAGVCDIRFKALLIVLVENLLTRLRERDTVWSLLAEPFLKRCTAAAEVQWYRSSVIFSP